MMQSKLVLHSNNEASLVRTLAVVICKWYFSNFCT